MKELRTYVADDGTKFDSRDECMIYKFQQRIDKNKNSFMLFDSTYKDTFDPSYVMYMYVKNEDGIKTIEKIYDNFGCRTPWDDNQDFRRAGIFYYDERFDEWFYIVKEQDCLTKALIAAFNTIKVKMDA